MAGVADAAVGACRGTGLWGVSEGSEDAAAAAASSRANCVGEALGGIVGSTCCVVVVVVVSVRCPAGIVAAAVAVRMGSRKGGGGRVMGVRSSRTERNNDRLILYMTCRPVGARMEPNAALMMLTRVVADFRIWEILRAMRKCMKVLRY